MRFERICLAAILLGLVSACSSDAPEPRVGPQTAYPVTYADGLGPNPGSLAPIEFPDGSIVTPQDIGEAAFPGADQVSDAAPAIGIFKETCVALTPDVAGIAQAGRAAGFDLEHRVSENVIFGVREQNGRTSSLQVNIASAYTYECAITTLTNQTSDADIRNAFFQSMGTTHSGGEGQIAIKGKTYILRHMVLPGGDFGFNEHAFLIQSN